MQILVIVFLIRLSLRVGLEEGNGMPKIIHVVTNDDYTLTIELSNNHRIIYDMRPRLGTTRFCALADMKKFQAVRIEQGNTLVWNNLCQITIDEIMEMIDR